MSKISKVVLIAALAMVQPAVAAPERYLDGPVVEQSRITLCNWLDSHQSTGQSFLKNQLQPVIHSECGWRFVSSLTFYEQTNHSIPRGYGHVFSSYAAKQKFSHICYNNICR